jgi:hypothetical protein
MTSLLFIGAITVRADEKPSAAPSTQPTHPNTPAWRAYERFLSMAGQKWEGHSTQGWTEQLSYSSVAGDSCVMEQSEMAGDGPHEHMVTMFHMDGDDLMLTHYCAAKNQPRMRATEISDDGSEMLFTFVDGTNMPQGRDTPHMDKARIKFTGDGAMQSQWTFYSKGKERWMEEISYKRIDGK